jgi:periplasmic nitrate reductase NapE
VSVESGLSDNLNRAVASKGSRKLFEALAFFILAFVIWPFVAIGVVSGWGFLVWMYYIMTGPPGPV